MAVAPGIYILFNRPDFTRRSFAAVRAARPAQLYLIADGPRKNRPEDVQLCREARRVVGEMLDWECDVTYDYSDVNLGCGRRVSSGLTRAFEQLGEAIVVEDDIVPQPSFFEFCTEMLMRYRGDPRIHAISGFNPIGRFASRDTHVGTLFWSPWGWASWARAWKDYSFDLRAWNSPAVQHEIRSHVRNDLYFQWLAHSFNEVLTGKVDTWDFQWLYTMMRQKRFAVASSGNLVENIGFRADATHTTSLLPFVIGLREHRMARNRAFAPVEGPDRTHDKVYGEIMMCGSRTKIALLRAATRFSPTLALLRARTDPA